jgi:hypothetical protein
MAVVIDIVSLKEGAEDLRYLFGRGYPRDRCLELVGNRYKLRKSERELLHRGVFSPSDAARRRQRLFGLEAINDAELAVDGHNVLITVEVAICGKPLIAADDGVIRDISGVSASYKMTDATLKAVDIIIDTLRDSRPKRVDFLFDAPISKSGKLAAYVADCLDVAGLVGDSRAVKVPETTLMGYQGVVATSDSVIIDRVEKVIDLAGQVIRRNIPDARLIEI